MLSVTLVVVVVTKASWVSLLGIQLYKWHPLQKQRASHGTCSETDSNAVQVL